MKVSVVAVTFTHDDDTDPVNAVDTILEYAVNRGLYEEELGLTASKLVISAPIATVIVEEENDLYRAQTAPDWESIAI